MGGSRLEAHLSVPHVPRERAERGQLTQREDGIVSSHSAQQTSQAVCGDHSSSVLRGWRVSSSCQARCGGLQFSQAALSQQGCTHYALQVCSVVQRGVRDVLGNGYKRMDFGSWK